VIGMNGVRLDSGQVTPPSPVTGDDLALVTPPRDLPRDQRKYWARYAPLAIAQQTLIPAHVPGFRELCEQAAFKDALAKQIRKLKPESSGASDVLRHYEKLVQRLDATLARFRLTGFGKPAAAASAARKATASPWAAVGK
jgi:hypothetical protein